MGENKRFTIDKFDLLDDGEPTIVEEVCELLNNFNDENKQLKQSLSKCEDDLDYYKSKCGSLEVGLSQSDREINRLEKENNELNSIKKFAERNGICIFNIDDAFWRCWKDNGNLIKENERLRQELFESERSYLIETSDISDKPYLDEEIEELKKRILG